MKKVMIVDDNSLAAEGIEKNIDWQALDAEKFLLLNTTAALRFGRYEKNFHRSDHFPT